MTCGRPRPDMKRAANREDEKSTQATSAPHVNSLVQAPYQVKDGSSLRTCIRHEEQLLSKIVEPALKGKIFLLGVGGHVEVVNKRVRDGGKQPRGNGLVCWVVEIRAQGLCVVEFKDRGVGEIETRQ